MIARDIDYSYPHAALLIFVALLGWGLFLALSAYRKKMLSKYAPEALFDQIAKPRANILTWIKYSLLLLGWCLASIALMGPKGHGHYYRGDQAKIAVEQEKRAPSEDVIFLIDASSSMSAKDTRLKLQRLDYAKQIVQAILSQLSNANVALYAFTSELTQLSPFTPDQLYIQLMLSLLKINEGDVAGTDILQALTKLHEIYFSKPTDKHYTLILLSDGEDNQIESLSADAKAQAIKSLSNQVEPSPGVDLRVYTIGMGSLEGTNLPDIVYNNQPVHSRLDNDLLTAISDKGRGKNYLANDFTPLIIAQNLEGTLKQKIPGPEITAASQVDLKENLIYKYYFQIPLGLALICLLAGLFWPEIVRKKQVQESYD